MNAKKKKRLYKFVKKVTDLMPPKVTIRCALVDPVRIH